MSDAPPSRIIGSEMEYDLQCSEESVTKVIEKGFLAATGEPYPKDYSGFLVNGGRLYPDVNHIEYATPECLGGHQLMLAEHAGRMLVKEVVKQSKVPHNGLYDRAVAVDYLNGTAQLRTSGYHENYCIPNDYAVRTRIKRFLPTFLASRAIWSGSGYLSHKGYQVSQKANGIGDDYAEGGGWVTTEGSKPMILIIRDGGTPQFLRCEVRGMDPTRSWFAKELGFDTTSLCLRLLEHPDERVRRGLPRFSKAYAELYKISYDTKATRLLNVEDGPESTAAEVQLRYAEAILDHATHPSIQLPPGELAAAYNFYAFAEELHTTVAKHAENLHLFKDRIDWIARMATLRRRLGQDCLMSVTPKGAYLDNLWDRIDTHDLGRLAFSEFLEDADIAEMERLQTMPPAGTRAAIRSNHLRSANKDSIREVYWESLVLGDEKLVSMPLIP
ncbi:MAG TPA: proteasome accessory factor PafA2 family protein [Candidatus Saccharimonadales bacterium]|nr:proteasome accessory factor PafA2 family protein [Candidatus Saccharimonadales bacterium]